MELFYTYRVSLPLLCFDEEESAHLVKVKRHRVGDEIMAVDGLGTLYRGKLSLADSRGAEAMAVESTREFGSHPYHLCMGVCPTKNLDRYEWFVEKATEIGINEIVPTIGEHSERRTLKTDRLERLVKSASKQSLKGRFPSVCEPCSVKDFIRGADPKGLRLIAYCDESLPREERISIGKALGDYLDSTYSDGQGTSASNTIATPQIYILIGPEGDFSPEEVSLARACGWQSVHLGDSRLRTETAALMAVSAVYLLIGQNDR